MQRNRLKVSISGKLRAPYGPGVAMEIFPYGVVAREYRPGAPTGGRLTIPTPIIPHRQSVVNPKMKKIFPTFVENFARAKTSTNPKGLPTQRQSSLHLNNNHHPHRRST